MTNLFLIDLTGVNLIEGQKFDGMAFGKFIDMMGREVELSFKDAEKFVTNTKEAIEATRSESGELVGLPIDAKEHDKGDAAGWIVDVELVDKIIRFTPKWTKIGIELISEGIKRFFSPTVNNRDKVILGGSLSNWIASTDKTGKVLLRPIELSQQIQTFELEKEEIVTSGYVQTDTFSDLQSTTTISSNAIVYNNTGGKTSPDDTQSNGDLIMLEMTQEEFDAKIADAVAAAQPPKEETPVGDSQQLVDLSQLAELMGINIDDVADKQVDQFKQLAELAQQQAEMKFRNQLVELKRVNQYTELAQRVTGGTPEAPRGIPMDADTLKAELMKLTPDQATFWGGLLESTVKGGLMDFGELGHGKKSEQKQPVPDYAHAELSRVIGEGVNPQQFFDALGLGDANDYDLTPFEGDK